MKSTEAAVCGNCDQYVNARLLDKRRKSLMICTLTGRHMSAILLAGCEYHPANRKPEVSVALTYGDALSDAAKELGYVRGRLESDRNFKDRIKQDLKAKGDRNGL